MTHQILQELKENFQTKVPKNLKVGQTVEVGTIIKEGDKSRIQKFKGLVIAIKGEGLNKTFTVRKISHGIGVEKIFPFYTPNISEVKIVKEEKVRRSKLYFMRDRVGKSAVRIKKGKAKYFFDNESVVDEYDSYVDQEGQSAVATQ